MDFLQLPIFSPSRRIEDCSESAMLSRGGKFLENDPSVSRIYNFYKIRGPLLSLMSRKSTPVFDSCFPSPSKQSIIDIPCTCRVWQWIMQKYKLLLMLCINSLTYVKTGLRLS